MSNVDSTDFAEAVRDLSADETLFIISSKTFGTLETLTNATSARDWVVGEPFGSVAPRFAGEGIALPQPDVAPVRGLKSLARAAGLGAAVPSLKRSPYDDFMMRFHNFLKENAVLATVISAVSEPLWLCGPPLTDTVVV